MEPMIEGVNYHRRGWKNDEWRYGVVFIVVLCLCFWHGLPAGDVSAWLALGMNLYVVGRMLYKRGRGMMGSSYGEKHSVTIQMTWNTIAMFRDWQSNEETAMWCALAYGVFCICRGSTKHRTGNK